MKIWKDEARWLNSPALAGKLIEGSMTCSTRSCQNSEKQPTGDQRIKQETHDFMCNDTYSQGREEELAQDREKLVAAKAKANTGPILKTAEGAAAWGGGTLDALLSTTVPGPGCASSFRLSCDPLRAQFQCVLTAQITSL